jgi:hypothetical protein
MGQQYSLFLDRAFQFRFEPNLGEMQRKRQGKKLRIRNLTGQDILLAVYKVLEPPCVTNCKVEKSVRHSTRIFIPYDELKHVDLYYKALSAVESALPGFKLYLYWVVFPIYKSDDPKPSLYSLAFEAQREAGRRPVDYKRLMELSIKYWPTIRDASYVNPEFEPIRLGGRLRHRLEAIPRRWQRPPPPQFVVRPPAFYPPLYYSPMRVGGRHPSPLPPPPPPQRPLARVVRRRLPSMMPLRPVFIHYGRRVGRMGGRTCSTSKDCEGLGYGNTCVEGTCVCRADKECEGIGIVCNKNVPSVPPIKDPTTQETLGRCRMREACGVGRFCPVGFSCSGVVSGTCERDLGEFDSSAIAKACLRHPKICYRLGKDTIDILRTSDLKKQGGPGPNAMRKLEDFILNLILQFLEDTHSVRDLIVRLNLDEKWLGCMGVSNADLTDPDRFEETLFKYLEVVAQMNRFEVQTFQSEVRRAPSNSLKNKIRDDFKQRLREKFYQLKKDIKSCSDKSLFRSRGRCRDLAEFALKNFRKCPVFTDFVNPEAGFISRQVAPILRELIDQNMLPDHLELIPADINKEVLENPKKYKNMRLATLNAINRVRIDGLTASSEIDVPFVATSRFLGRTRLATADELKSALSQRLRDPDKPLHKP